MQSKTTLNSYCDCGHRGIYHIKQTFDDESENLKCFGRDRDIFEKATGKYRLDDEVVTELMNNEVLCQCKTLRLVG
jgi:hypothetical protein